jgi:hypothetical protein
MTQTGVDITMNGQKIGVGVKTGNLYRLKNKEDAEALTSDYLTHRRMGHSSSHPAENCEVWHSAKQQEKVFRRKVLLNKTILDSYVRTKWARLKFHQIVASSLL